MQPPLFWRPKFAEATPGVVLNRLESDSAPEGGYTYLSLETERGIRIPGRATFGGFWPDDDLIGSESAVTILDQQIGVLISATITMPPAYFLPEIFNEQQESLLRRSEICFTDSNFHITVNDWTVEAMSKGNRKKLRQFKESGGAVRREVISEASACYDLLLRNRRNRGAMMSLSSDAFEGYLKFLPDDYYLFSAWIGEVRVATAYVIRLTNNILYVFFWGDDINYRGFSPVVALLEHLTDFARSIGATILDLGISSVEGELDEGLARFKYNLGASCSTKLTLALS